MKKTIVSAATCLLLTIPPAAAGTNVLSGGLTLRQGFDSNIERTAASETTEWTTALEPFLRLRYSAPTRTLELRYAPSLVYNHRLDDSHMEHRLSAAAGLAASRTIRLAVREAYTKTDDTTLAQQELAADGQPTLTDNRQRRTYWHNALDLAVTWELERDTSLEVGYRHTILDNRAFADSDYQRHEPYLVLNYRWNPQWSGRLTVAHTVGDFDQGDDLVRHETTAGLFYHLDPHRQLFAELSRTVTDYDGSRIDYSTTRGHLGYQAQISATTSLTAAVGWSATDRTAGTDDDSFSYRLSLDRALVQGSLTLTGEGGFTGQEFNGDNDGITRFWSLTGNINLELARRLTGDAGVAVRVDDYLERTPAEKETTYEGKAGLTWQAGRWHSLGLRYAYRKVDADQPFNDYTDHRLYLTVSFSKDLWKG